MKLRIFAALLLSGITSVCIAACGNQVITGTGGGGTISTGIGGGGAPACLEDDETCSSDDECCSGLCDGYCWTSDESPDCGYGGDFCSSDDECCDGPCIDGTCTDVFGPCNCACGAGSPPALVCNDPAHPSCCAGVPPVPGGMCETALMTYCAFTYDDIASLACTP